MVRKWKVMAVAALLGGMIPPLVSHAMYSYELFTSITDEWGLIDNGKAAAFRAAPPVPGEWSTNLSKCRAYAEETGRPLFACWGKWNCAHCAAFDEIFFTEEWKRFMQTPPWNEVVYCYCPGNEGQFPESAENGADFNWMGGTDMSGGSLWWTTTEFPGRGYIEGFPFVAFYWYDGRVDWHYDAEYALSDDGIFPWGETVPLLEREASLENLFRKWFAGWQGLNANAGGDFVLPADGGEKARLEAEVGLTTWVDVPLARTNGVDKVATNLFVSVYKGARSPVQVVEWLPGSSVPAALPRVAVPTGVQADEVIELVLMKENEDVVATSQIVCVPPENSPLNPHWIGEKTASTLGFGEWTMDFTVATNKVAAFNRGRSQGAARAYTLLLLEGALWCGDCESTDANLFNYTTGGVNPFLEWAKRRNVALVAYDIPNLKNDNPTGEGYPALLRGDVFEIRGTMRSGAGYLSRHMIDPRAAAAALASFSAYAGRDVREGGLHRPEWTGNNYRPGVPTLFVLRGDGSVAGRITAFGMSGPSEYKSCYLDRLDELLALVDDPQEESNGDWRTTTAELGPRDMITNSLSHADQSDVYKLVGAVGQNVKAELRGTGNATVTLALAHVVAGELTPLASASGTLSGGVSIERLLDADEDLYLLVTGAAESFRVDHEGSTLAQYELKTDNVLVPTEQMNTWSKEGETDVTIRFTAGKRYYIEGLGAFSAQGVAYTGVNVYEASASGDITLPLREPGCEVKYLMPGEAFFPSADVGFLAGDHPNDRLEAEVGKTTFVDVPLVRTNAHAGASMVRLVAVADGATNEYAVAWGAGQTRQFVRIPVPGTASAGDLIGLSVRTGVGVPVAASHVACVAPCENSSVNPYWFGEKTAETLAFGEWTMDLNILTNKIAAFNQSRPRSRAYAITVIQGSLWCPNCWKMETNMWDRAEVKAWALRNNVVFGVVDIDTPAFTYENNPTLLTYDSFLISYAPGTEAEKWHAGAGYLSRHMADAEQVAGCISRNRRLVCNSTLDDGWCRPERMTKEWKTGVPMIVLLRGDGSIAGRLDEFNWGGPGAYGHHLLTRLDELLALDAQPDEEANNDWQTTPCAVSPDATVGGSLSALDRVDAYALRGANMDLTASVNCPTNTTILLRLLQCTTDELGNRVVTELAQAAGDGAQGVQIEYAVTSSNLYIEVQGSARGQDDRVIEFWNDEPTERAYTLTTSAVLTPAGDMATYQAAEGARTVKVRVKAGTVYWFEGVDALPPAAAAVLEKSDREGEENLYYANSDAELELPLTVAGGRMAYSVFESGEFGFSETFARIEEDAGGARSKEVEFKVFREGGAFGPANILVALSSASDIEPERYVWTNQVVSWVSGEVGEKTLSFTLKDDEFYDAPTQYLVLEVRSTSSGEIKIARNAGTETFAIVENDEIAAGQLALTGADPAFARNMTVYAVEGSEVQFEVTREKGVSGVVSAHLRMVGDGFDPIVGETLTWENRTRQPERVTSFTVPMREVCAKAAVTIIPDGEVRVDANRRSVTVYVVSANAPRFKVSDIMVPAYRYAKISTPVGIENLSGEGAVTVERMFGSLPPGVTAKYVDDDGGALLISGSAARTGVFTAAYRVSQERDGVVVNGTTVSVRIEVGDIPVNPGQTGANPSLGRTRIFRNVPIVAEGGEPGNPQVRGRMVGLLTLTLPQTGRASAKFTSMYGTFAYSTMGWDGFAEGVATCELACTRADSREKMLSVEILPDGTVHVSMDSLNGGTNRWSAVAVETDWMSMGGAGAFAGTYNVQLPQSAGGLAGLEWTPPHAQGDGWMSLRMSNSQAAYGRMTFCGMLPNGRTVSGSGELIALGENAVFPFFVSASSDVFAGAVSILPNAALQQSTPALHIANRYIEPVADAWPYWIHQDKENETGASFNVFGGYYDMANIYSECIRLYSCSDVGLIFTGKKTFSNRYGESLALDTVLLTVSEGMVSLSPYAVNPRGVNFYLTPSTGVYSGAFTLDFGEGRRQNATFRGVVIPGWGGCEECGRPLPGPFGGGAFWYADTDGSGGASVGGGPVRINKKDE